MNTISHHTISLNGFIAGPGDSIDWAFGYGAPTSLGDDKQCLVAGLLDEIVLHVAPVLLGSGVRLFDGEVAEQVELERISVGEADQLTDLSFRVRHRPPQQG